MNIYIILTIIILAVILIYIFIYLLYKFPGLFLPNKINNNIHEISHLVGEYNIFDKEQAEQINEHAQTIISENNHQSTNSVMDVIGYPTYLYPGNIVNNDIYSDKTVYYTERNEHNNILLDNVSFMYPVIINKLSDITRTKCEYPVYDKTKYKNTKYTSDYMYSLPGFHIFKGGSWLGSGWDVASLHVDLQFNKLNFENNPFFEFNIDDVFSFTIPIQMPDDCGLYIYDKTQIDITSTLPLSYSLRNFDRYKIDYKVGNLYIHDGLHFHMISSFNSSSGFDRITIQGHGIYCKTTGSYWIYW